MADWQAALEAMVPPMRQEYHAGCADDEAAERFLEEVTPLLAEALRRLGSDHPAETHLIRLQAIFREYPGLSAEVRRERLREAKRRIDAMLGVPPKRAGGDRRSAPRDGSDRHRDDRHRDDGRRDDRRRDEPLPGPRDEPPPRRRPEPERPSATARDLVSPVKFLKGVGPQRAALLARLGVETIGDLLFHFPRRHEDRSQMAELGSAPPDELVTYQGTIRDLREITPRGRGRRLTILKAYVRDRTGAVNLVWFNQPWLREQLTVGQPIIFSGRLTVDKYGERQIVQPTWETLDSATDPIHTGRLVPIYPLTEGLVQTTVRRWLKLAVDQYTQLVPEVLPERVREAHDLVGRQEAIRSYHFPADETERVVARRRLVFEEFFGLQVALAQRRFSYRQERPGIPHRVESPLREQLLASLPFELTGAQQKVLNEILADLAAPQPMNRLVQGDVGSGKTLVALAAMLTVVDSGHQVALMVPTEVLAEQHHRVIRHWCEPLGVTVDLLTGRAGARQRRESQERLNDGTTQIAIGTHALIQGGVDFDGLGLVVIDEQHRFGVSQRKLLTDKGEMPDVLVMTATPIPRTLALTAYGDLDTSVIDELPPGRQPIVTSWHPLGRRRQIYAQIKERLREGRQAYVVCPLVEESEALVEVEAATAVAEHLTEQFPGFTVGLIHGRLKSAEKDEVMERFRAGEIDLLAATTVIEVGIDVPNATIMLILNADRFGLAQLHQLRGRVGRGQHDSECYLLTEARYNPDLTEDESNLQYRDGRARMRFMVQYADGFKLAEADLDLRGPGELGGTRQSGVMDLRVAHLTRDEAVLRQTRAAAQALIETDPYLEQREHAALADLIRTRYRDRGELAEVG